MLSNLFSSIKSKGASTILRCSLALLPLLWVDSHAQEKPTVNFRSRGLFDLGYTSIDGQSDRLRPHIADLRVGAKVGQAAWSFKIDIGLSGSKISIKDLLFDYNFGRNSLTIGNAYEPFSMDMITSSVDLTFFESASSAQGIANGRRFGLTYYMRPDNYFGAVGLYTDNSINALFESKNTSRGIALTTKHLYRNILANGNLFQAGGAISIRTVDNRSAYAEKGIVKLASVGCSSFVGENIVAATVEQAQYNIRGNIELLAIINRWKIQSEHSALYVARHKGMRSYTAYGGYIQLSYLFGQSKYGYDADLAVPARASKGGIELSIRADYIQANHSQSQIYGGQHTDLSMGVSYFFDRHFAAKFNLNYTLSGAYANPAFGVNCFTSAIRLQYSF